MENNNTKTITTLTTIYSEPSIEKVKRMVDIFLSSFEIYGTDFDKMFYCGVFCATNNYALFDWPRVLRESNIDCEVPEIFLNPCATEDEKIDYVKKVIEQIMKGEIEKPCWMKYIEMEEDANDACKSQPSTFLRLLAKENKYEYLGKMIIDFLYSPNRTTVVY